MTDEAKLRVAALRWAHLHEDCNDADDSCPVQDECLRCTNVLCNLRTAANLIVSLSAELEQVKRERDAAVESMRGWCTFCAHDERGKLLRESPVCLACMHNMDDEDLEDNWQWRGIQEEHK